MNEWPKIPTDAIRWFRRILRIANSNVSNRMIRNPNIRETSLDDGLIESLVDYSAPMKLGSGATVELEIHNIGGLRRYSRWETADIAFIVRVSRNGKVIGRKIGLLQSKRLYPENRQVEIDDEVNFDLGMNRFLDQSENSKKLPSPTNYRFDLNSKYVSIKAVDDQLKRIAELNSKLGECTYYLFYNPPQLPCSIDYPHTKPPFRKSVKIGARVCKATNVELALSKLEGSDHPTFTDINVASPDSNWSFERWGADLLLKCKVGSRIDTENQQSIGLLLERRSGPIASAISVNVDLSNQ